MGTAEVAAHSVVGNLNWMTFVIPMTLGSAAAAIRVGFHVGAGDFDASRRTIRAALTLSVGYAICVSAVLVFGRHVVATVYTEDAAVLAIAANLLLFVAVYQIADDIQATLAGCLRGYKDTQVPMLISLVGYWGLALPVGVAFGFGLLGLPEYGVYGLWLGMTLGLFIVATTMALRARMVAGDDASDSRPRKHLSAAPDTGGAIGSRINGRKESSHGLHPHCSRSRRVRRPYPF